MDFHELVGIPDHGAVAELIERLIDALFEHGLLVGAVAEAVAHGKHQRYESEEEHDEAVAKAAATFFLRLVLGRDGVFYPLRLAFFLGIALRKGCGSACGG